MNEIVHYFTPTKAAAAPLGAMARQAFSDAFAHLYDPAAFTRFLDQAYGPNGTIPIRSDAPDGHVLWEVPLATTEDLVPFSQYLLGKTGTPNLGGPIVTTGGLVFIGAAMDTTCARSMPRRARNSGAGAFPPAARRHG